MNRNLSWDQSQGIEWHRNKLRAEGLPNGNWFAFEQGSVPFRGVCRFFSESAMRDLCTGSDTVTLSSFLQVDNNIFNQLVDQGLFDACFISEWVPEGTFRKMVGIPA